MPGRVMEQMQNGLSIDCIRLLFLSIKQKENGKN